MADTTNISWTDATWNIITGCTLVDEGCRNCYAAHLAANWPALARHPSRAGLARNNADGVAKFTGEVRFNEQWLDQPLRWRKPRRIFVCAHGDLFHESVPDDWIDRVFAVMALCPQHSFQVLTKRPDRARAYLANRNDGRSNAIAVKIIDLLIDGKISGLISESNYPFYEPADEELPLLRQWPLANVWMGTFISDQASAKARIPDLLRTPAAVRFVSAEPLLGQVNLRRIDMTDGHTAELDALTGKVWYPGNCGESSQTFLRAKLDWVITGGESGKNARPAHPDWFRSLRDQCVAAGVPFHFKQWGAWGPDDAIPVETTGQRKLLSDGNLMIRAGTKHTGHLLDGVAWKQFPGKGHA
jgi:protein gp37